MNAARLWPAPFDKHCARRVLPLGLLLCATALRVYRLDFQPLWWDEGLSLFFARLDFFSILKTVLPSADVNPPLYRMLLGGWLNLVGWSVFTTRLFSALPGVVLVALVYRLARALRYAPAVALSAMGLCAASPALIYYAQEAKGYTLEALAGVASVLVWLKLHPAPARPAQKRWWGVWGATLLLAFGTHYLSVFLVVAENLWTLARTLQDRRQFKQRWEPHWRWQLGTQLGVALILLAFVLPTFAGTRFLMSQYPAGGWPILSTVFSLHIVDLACGPAGAGPAGGLLALTLLGLALLGASRPHANRWLVVSWLGLSGLGGLLYHLYRDFFTSRFLLYAVPAWLLLAARGLTEISRSLARRFPRLGVGVGNVLCAALCGPLLYPYYTTPRNPNEDARPLFAQVRNLLRSGDALWINYTWQEGYLAGYATDLPLTVYRAFDSDGPITPTLASIFSAHPRLWVLNYQVDTRNTADYPFNAWLQTNTVPVFDSWYGNAHLALVARPAPLPASWPAHAAFQNEVQLDYAFLQASAQPGDSLLLNLRWQRGKQQSTPYALFVHLRRADGSLVAQNDAAAEAGPVVLDRRGLLIPLDTPPGRYTLYAGAYETQAPNARLSLAAPVNCDTPDSACIGEVEVYR